MANLGSDTTDAKVKALEAESASINGGQVYVQDTRPDDLASGDRWLSPPIAPAVGSPVARYPLSEGAGDAIIDDAGDNDGVRNGLSWVSGDWVGGYALEGAGSGHVSLTDMGVLGAAVGGPLTVAWSFETTDSNAHWGVDNGSATNTFYAETDDDGYLSFIVRDDDSTESRVTTDSAFDDGDKHRAVLTYEDVTTPSDWTVAVDGDPVSHTVDTDEGPSNFVEWTEPLTLFAFNNGGGIQRNLDGTIDNPQFQLDHWSGGMIQTDYDRQPWV